MRGRTPEPVDLVTAVDRISAVEKDRIWHGRVVVQFREPRSFHALRPIGAAGRAIAGAAGRNGPAVAWHAVHGNHHLLRAFFFSSRRRHTRLQGDWSSDVCSSD